MESNYDEDLSENSFFQILQSDHSEIFQTATVEGWVICVPRAGSLPKYTLSQDDILSHILVPSDELPESHYRTLNDKDVRISNRIVTVEQDDIARPYSTHILFEETFYTDEMLKYKVVCVECPLDRSAATTGATAVDTVLTLRDCIDLLWTESTSKVVFEDMDGAIADFLSSNADLELHPAQDLRDCAGTLYARCLRMALRDSRLGDKASASTRFLQAVQVAVETYVHHAIHTPLMSGLTACHAAADARLNKSVRGLADLQLRDVGVRPDLDAAVTHARNELAAVNRYATVLGKLGCLRRAVSALSLPSAGSAVAADDLLPAVVFAVLKARTPNWTANLAFLRQFRYSAAETANDQADFLVTTLEAAIEHIRSGVLEGSSAPEGHYPHEDDNDSAPEDDFFASPSSAVSPQSVAGLFALVRKGDIDGVIGILDRNQALPMAREGAEGGAKASLSIRLATENKLHPSKQNTDNLLDVKLIRSKTKDSPMATDINNQDSNEVARLGEDTTAMVAGSVSPATSERRRSLVLADGRGGASRSVKGVVERRRRPPNQVGGAGGRLVRVASDGSCHPLCTCDRCQGAASRELCRTSPTVLSCDSRGLTALHVACLSDSPQLVDLLIQRGANLAAADCSGATPIHYACAKGRQNAVLLLAHSGAPLGAVDNDGNTPLHLAADHGHDGCAKALVYFNEHAGGGLDVNARNNVGDTALHHASRWGFDAVVSVLLSGGASPTLVNRRGASPLALAHSRHIAARLASAGAGASPAVAQGRAQRSLDFNETPPGNDLTVKPTDHGERPESTSAMRGVERLLRAVTFGDVPLAAFYLGVSAKGASPAIQTTPFMQATPPRCHPLCRCARCDDVQAEEGEEPEDSRDLVSVNACDADGLTALHVASTRGHAAMVRLCLACGARPNATSRNARQTPLHLAARGGRVGAASALLDAGAHVDAKDGAGDTALHHAARAGDARMVETLLASGGDPDLRNAAGLCPSDVASGNTRLGVLRLLRGGQPMALS